MRQRSGSGRSDLRAWAYSQPALSHHHAKNHRDFAEPVPPSGLEPVDGNWRSEQPAAASKPVPVSSNGLLVPVLKRAASFALERVEAVPALELAYPALRLAAVWLVQQAGGHQSRAGEPVADIAAASPVGAGLLVVSESLAVLGLANAEGRHKALPRQA